jgi:hypothetical protein
LEVYKYDLGVDENGNAMSMVANIGWSNFLGRLMLEMEIKMVSGTDGVGLGAVRAQEGEPAPLDDD